MTKLSGKTNLYDYDVTMFGKKTHQNSHTNHNERHGSSIKSVQCIFYAQSTHLAIASLVCNVFAHDRRSAMQKIFAYSKQQSYRVSNRRVYILCILANSRYFPIESQE